MLKTNKPLWMLSVIFLLPIIVSGILFQYHSYFRLKTLNHGTFITPPLTLTHFSSNQKKWRVIYLAEKKCGDQCQQIYHQLQQVKKALGKDSDRVDTMLMRHDPAVNKIYLVDPLGNAFMYYSADANPMDILNDLKRVLEVSQIG